MWSQLSTNAQKVSLFGATLRATVDGNTFQGTLHYCDDQFLLLKNDDEFYFLNQQQLTEVQPLDVADPQVTLQNLLNVDLGKLTEDIIRQEIKEPQQLLFEHISKLYGETEWQGQDIVIPTIGIRIVAPYTSGNILGENKRAVERLRKIVMIILSQVEKYHKCQ